MLILSPISFLSFSVTFIWNIFEFEKNAGPGGHNAGLPTGPADLRSLKGFSLHLPLALKSNLYQSDNDAKDTESDKATTNLSMVLAVVF